MNIGRRRGARGLSEGEYRAYLSQMEESFPGYLEERDKLKMMVYAFTGVRVFYALFYLWISRLYGLSMQGGLLNLLTALIFFGWYSLMLQSGRAVAAFMLVARGIGLSTGGAVLIQNSFYLPFPIIFTTTAALVMQFLEAVFCIYVLVNSQALATIRLNRQIAMLFSKGIVPGKRLGQMASYKNEEATADEEEEKPEGKGGEEGKD